MPAPVGGRQVSNVPPPVYGRPAAMLSLMALLWRLVSGGSPRSMAEPAGELRPPVGLRTSRRHTAEGVVGDRLTIRRLQRRAWKRRSGDAGYPFGHRKSNKEVRSGQMGL